MKEDPAAVPPDVPRELEKVIARCLRKDPGRRYQHADDLKLALVELKEESDSGKLGAAVTVGATTRRVRLWWGLIAALLLAAFSLGTWMRWFRSTTVTPAALQIVPLTSYAGQQGTPALSPDGKQVAFSWDGEKGDNFDIYVKLVNAGTPLRLTTNPARDVAPEWSPDGSQIAFLRILGSTAEVLVIPSLGGRERKVGQVGMSYEIESGLSWSPDGSVLAVVDHTPAESASIYFLSIETGEKRRITSPPHEFSGDFQPRFSPDGNALAFVRSRHFFTSDIYLLKLSVGGSASAEPGRVTSVPNRITGVDWTPDGRNLVFSSFLGSGGFALQKISIAGGQPGPLPGAGENGVWPSVSRHGNRLAYQREVGDPNIWRLPGPRSNRRPVQPEKWIASTEIDREPQYSPDGKRIVFSSLRSGSGELWTSDSEGREPAQLTSFTGPPAGSPRWSPDSRWIAFDAPKAGYHIFVISADGGKPHLLTRGTASNVRPSWSADGKWIYFGSNRGGDWEIWRTPAQGGEAVQVTKAGGYEAFESQDGRSVLYARQDRPGIWSVAVGGGEGTQVLDKAGVGNWAVAKDGICFFDWKDALHPTVQFYNFSSRRSTTQYEFPRGTNLDRGSTAISVSPDERWILYTQIDHVGSNLVLVENFH